MLVRRKGTAWRQNLGRHKGGGATRAGVEDTAAVPRADVTAHINDTAGLLANAGKIEGENQRVVPEWMAKKKPHHMRSVQHKLDKLESLYFFMN